MSGARRYQSYDDSASALPSRSNKSAKLLRHCAAITPKFPNSAEWGHRSVGGIEGTCTQIPINGVISSPRAPWLPQTRAETPDGR